MQVTLIQPRAISRLSLPDRFSGKYWLQYSGPDDKLVDLIAIEGVNDSWVLKSNRSASIVDGKGERVREVAIEPNSFYNVSVHDTGERVMVHSEPATDDRRVFRRFMLPQTGVIVIGRDGSCQIHSENTLVSGRHAQLTVSAGSVTAEDLGSSNGTFVNGRRIVKRACRPGDAINIMGLVLIVGAGFIAINNPDGTVTVNERLLEPLAAQEMDPPSEEEFVEGSPGHRFFRSPRFMRTITTAKINLDPQPNPDRGDERPTMLVVGPMLTMGVASLVMVVFTLLRAFGSSSPDAMSNAIPMVAMSFSMLLSMALWPTLTRRWETKRRAEREVHRRTKYGAYLDQKEAEIEAEAARQREVLFENVTAISQCVHRIRTRDRALWDRVSRHYDFLSVRLGVGDIPLDLDLQYQQRKFTLDDDDMQEAMLRVAEQPRFIREVPYAVSLVNHPIVGLIGDRGSAEALVDSLIVQIAALHSYDEVKVAFIYPSEDDAVWGYTRVLPHSWSDDRSARFLAQTPAEIRNLSQILDTDLSARAADKGALEPSAYSPHYVVFVLDRQLGQSGGLTKRIHEMEGFRGFSVIHLCDELHELPRECDLVVDISEGEARVFDRNDTTGAIDTVRPDLDLEDDTRELAVLLANTKLELTAEDSQLPNVVTYLEMFGVGKVEHLNVQTRWQESNPVASLGAPVGIDKSGEPFILDLHEKHHGPHGLVAGMTGSGKSEFIMAYILSMAVNFHPDEVAFVLIDYKGGGMANSFATLPHVAGTITNLDGNAINRSLMSIQSELQRRQTIFNMAAEKTGTSNIDIYKYQSLYREGVVEEPLPHLLVISDEFAELKTQQPDFMRQLVSAARIGRSLGVHLILATQKPSGVVDDQIWSNSRFRVCLKVQEKADSMEVIKRADAAELSQAGRFYLQVGYNELFDIGQSAWPGAPYYPADRVERARDDSVIVVDNQGSPTRLARLDNRRSDAKPTKQLDEVTAHIVQIAQAEGIVTRPLWLDPIPQYIFVDQLLTRYPDAAPVPYVLNPVIGELDDPANQRQDVLTLPISTDGNTLLFGSPGSGKTLFLSTMAYSLIVGHTPDEVTLYMIDFEAETLRAFSKAPHVGEVLFSSDVERIETLFDILSSEVTRRRAAFSDHGGDYRSYVNAGMTDKPSIVVMIHNYAALVETIESAEDSITYLSREGVRYGIYLVLSASASSAVRFRIAQNFKQVFVMQLNDPTEYSGILGATGGVTPAEIHGRGIFKRDAVFEFQIAHPSSAVADDFIAIRKAADDAVENWGGEAAGGIPAMPEFVTPDMLAPHIAGDRHGAIPVGLESKSFEPVEFDFTAAFVTMALGRDEGVWAVARAMTGLLSTQYSNHCIVADPGNRFNSGPEGVSVSHTAEEIEAMVEALFSEMVRRHKDRSASENGEASPEAFDPTLVVVLGMGQFMGMLDADTRDKWVAIFTKCDRSLGVNFVFVDDIAQVTTYIYDSWVSKHFDQQAGLWVGNGFGDQFNLRPTSPPPSVYSDVHDGYGWVLKAGEPTLVKFVSDAQDGRRVDSGE